MKIRRIFSARQQVRRKSFLNLCATEVALIPSAEFSLRISTTMNISRSIGRRKLLCRRFTLQWIEIECCLGEYLLQSDNHDILFMASFLRSRMECETRKSWKRSLHGEVKHYFSCFYGPDLSTMTV